MEIYTANDQYKFLELLSELEVTFEDDLMVVIKSTFGFKGGIVLDDKYIIATECMPRVKDKYKYLYDPLYETRYVPKNKQTTTAVVLNMKESAYFTLGKHDLLFMLPERNIIIVICGMDKRFTKWLLRQDVFIMDPKNDFTRIDTIIYPDTEPQLEGYERLYKEFEDELGISIDELGDSSF